MRAYPVEHRTIAQILHDKAELHPEALYLRTEDDRYSYADVEIATNELAAGLLAHGVERGHHVAIVMDNSPDYLWLTFALGKIGAVAVPINTAAKGQLLRYYLDDADCRHIVLDAAYRVVVDAALAEGRPLDTVIVRTAPGSDGEPVGGAARDLATVRGDGGGHGERPPDADVSFRDPWFIMYTSGTTGPSKGVVCPQAHPLTVGYRVAERFGLDPQDRLYTFLPLFHGNALWYSSLTAIWADASIALAPRFSARRFWPDVHRYGATEFNAIMTVATILEKMEPTALEADNPLRMGFVVPLPREREALEERWGLKFTCNYSMTELTPATVLGPGEGYGKGNSSGTVSSYMDVRIVDDDDLEVPAGTPGEVTVRPHEPWTTFTEYYAKPEATAAALRNVWFHTGDRGLFDEDGHFFFVDRKKDAIRRRGENISAHEIEHILESDPRIAEAAALPVPSEMGEDDVAVYVVRNDGALTERDVIEFAQANMAYYMVPRYVGFIDEVPKTPSHKKTKVALHQRAHEEYRRLWDREAHGIVVSRPQVPSG